MSTIAAGLTTGTALVSSGDTTGALVLQTNGTTTAVTIGTNQVVTLAQPLPVASGGTGSVATPTAGGIFYGTGTVQAVSAAGTSGQLLQSNGASAPAWATITSTPTVVLSSRTANTILGTADASKLIDITSGTFSQTFTAAATLGSGWFCYIRNSGTGDITLDPNASELIDGLSTYIMYTGETRLVQCSGTAFTSIVLSPFSRTFSATGTFTKPPGYSYFGGLLWSGGASGGRSGTAGLVAYGGAGGGCFPFTILSSTMAATETITIGAGGAAKVSSDNAQNAGGNSSVGSFFTVYGASGSTASGSIGITGRVNTTSTVGVGFEGAGSATPTNATYGGACAGNAATTNIAGSSVYGGAGGGGVTTGNAVSTPGTSKFGGNGGASSSASSGSDGTAPGGGGGGTQTGTQSGKGGDGQLNIWGIA
jgi:hypothetical protein